VGASTRGRHEGCNSEGVKTKLTLPIAFVLGLLAPLALPAGAAEAVVGAMAAIGDMHIMEFAVTANALTIVF
jgi:hypothetical protein